ncbi:MAG: hypothetical protein IRZ07_17935 [Microbispora sp.]|nr:hypothetical protein [Microbispora sp.]
MSGLPAFAVGLCDDAAVFPPGLTPLPEAVPAHLRHRACAYGAMVGPFVLAAPALGELGPLLGPGGLDLVVTVPGGPEQIPEVARAVEALPVNLRGLEVVVPAGAAPAEFFAALDRACAGAPRLSGVPVFVEVPRDGRRTEIVSRLAGSGRRAKFRTGGVTAELYPDEAELAAAIRAVVDAGVPFKATAGLHHAIRNTDPETGFEQHGFLNLLLAADAALGGGAESELAAILAERDGAAVAARVAALGEERVAAARSRFLSFGTCSITDPLTDLLNLGLIPDGVAGAMPGRQEGN